MFKARVALAATLSANYGSLQRLRAARARADPGQGGISQFGEIRDQDARLGQARQHQGLYRPAQPDAARQPGAAADQHSALCPGRRRRGDRLRQGIGRPRQRGGGRDRAVAATARASSGSISAISRSARSDARRRVSAIENLVTGERHRDRMGRRAAAHRSGARSRPCCFAAMHEGRRSRERIAAASASSVSPRATTSGTRTRSSISCTSRRSPTATTTASAISPA